MNQYLQVILLLDVTDDEPVGFRLLAPHRVVSACAATPASSAITLVKDAQNSYKNYEHG
jgi:hypothetical protein